MKCISFFVLLLLPLSWLTSSCSILRKHKTQVKESVDSVSVKTYDSSAYHFVDTASKKEVIETKEGSIEIEFDTTASEVDTLRAPMVNGDDYFKIPIKQKVRKITVHTSQTENTKDSSGKKEVSQNEVKKEDLAKYKKTVEKKEESKSRCSFPYVWLTILIAAIVWLYIRRKKIMEWFAGGATGV